MLADALAPVPETSRPDRRFLDALRTKIEPVSLPLTYKAALAVVALAMVLLPLLYVALIGLAAWGVAWYAMNGWGLLAGVSSSRLRAVSYITPLVVGGTVVLFMIKPLFTRRPKDDDEVPLDPAKEPLLFEFVRRTAVAVGAPVPREIRLDHEVNASASLRRGLFSLFSDDLVLTIGVPLAAGMTVEQLAGVLAHEFGHFGQRAGMRLSYIVRSVNYWFARVVYERDRFDAQLDEAVKEGDVRLRLVAAIAAGFVWVGRTILKGLMYVGHVISSSLLRQMEFDADRYTVRLVGRRVHASILRDVFVLSQVHGLSLAGLREQYQQRSLPDSLALMMGAHRQRFAGPLDNAYKEHLSEGRTSLFDTHPTDRERITKSLGGPPQGVFACDLPASVVFSDFASLERKVSRDVFQGFLGRDLPDDVFVPAEKAVAAFTENQRDGEAAERYLPGGVSILHPLPLPSALPAPPAEPLPALTAASGAVEVGRKDAVAILERYSEIYNQRSQANRAGNLLAYGVPIDAASFGLGGPKGGDPAAVREAQSAATAQLEELARRLEPARAAAAHRLTLALSLLPGVAGRMDEGAAWQEQVPRLLAAADRLREVLPLLLDLQETRALLAMVGSLEDREGTLVGTLTELTRRGQTRLQEVLATLDGVADPFPEEPIPLSRLAAPDGLPPAEPAPVYHAIAGTTVLFDLYGRILGRLCRIAEGVEAAVAPAVSPARG